MSDLMKTMPSDPELRSKVVKAVKEMVDYMLQESSAKEGIKDIKDTTKELHGICPAYLGKLAKIQYDREYANNKTGMRIEADAEILAEVETHFK